MAERFFNGNPEEGIPFGMFGATLYYKTILIH